MAEVLVEGRSFYPPMLADIEAATPSVHINQFGFRPGKVGDVFARALAEKARSGAPARLVVDENALIANASAKPSVVTKPASLPSTSDEPATMPRGTPHPHV